MKSYRANPFQLSEVCSAARAQLEDLMTNLVQKVQFDCESLKMEWCFLVSFDFGDDALDDTSHSDDIPDSSVVSADLAKPINKTGALTHIRTTY